MQSISTHDPPSHTRSPRSPLHLAIRPMHRRCCKTWIPACHDPAKRRPSLQRAFLRSRFFSARSCQCCHSLFSGLQVFTNYKSRSSTKMEFVIASVHVILHFLISLHLQVRVSLPHPRPSTTCHVEHLQQAKLDPLPPKQSMDLPAAHCRSGLPGRLR